MEWTKEQQKAIDHKQGSAIVSASAGSGKTAILVARILSIIKDEEHYTPADELVIMTFTKKAAAELRSRLNKAISEAAEADNSEFLNTQLVKFQSAKISTINSFCLSIIKSNIQKADLAVNFSVLDDAEKDIMAAKAMELTLNRLYEEIAQDRVKEICDYFVSTTDEKIGEAVTKLHTFMSNVIDPIKWSEEQLYYYNNPKEGYKFFNDRITEKTLQQARYVADAFEQLKQKAAKYELNDVLNVLDKDSDSFSALPLCIEKKNYSALVECCSKRLSSFSKKLLDNPIAEHIKTRRDKLKDMRKELLDYIYSEEDFVSDCKVQAEIITTLFELCDIYEDEFSKMKQAKNSVDFNDIERKLLVMLEDKTFAHSVANECSCIIVDEFQDTNDIQYEIFRRISKNEQNLYFVGDVKQSIYGFRAANPKNIASICKDSKYTCLPLNSNFRSRREVVDTVNAVFSGFMTEECGDADYNDGSKLNYGATYKNGENNRTEIHFLKVDDYQGEEADNKKTEHEASFVAERISEMLESGFRVQDKNGELRPCRKSDFCILLRSTKGKTKIFVDRLKEAGIESISGGINDYLALNEVNLMLDLLRIIDNPLKNTELLNVLMSPLYMMTANEIAEIRLGISGFDISSLEKQIDFTPMYNRYKKYSLYNCVAKCAVPFDIEAESGCFSEKDLKLLRENALYVRTSANEKCARFIRDFLELRAFMSNNSIERLVRKIYDSTDFFSVISVYEYSSQKVANLRRLLGYVSSFEKHTGGTLSDFLQYIDSIKENKGSLSSVSEIADNADAVSVMTMHSSKGLEFPICFICDLGKSLNTMDEKFDLLCHLKGGMGMRYVDRKRLLKYGTLAHASVKIEIDKQMRSEEMRLLYVALTRAREKLIMTCCTAKGIESFFDYVNSREDYTARMATDKNSVLDWIESSVSRYFTNESYSEEKRAFSSATAPIDVYDSTCNGNVYGQRLIEKELLPDIETVERISTKMSFKYGDETLTQIPQKFTATDLAKDKDLLEDYSEVFNIYLTRPEFMHGETISGKQVGDAYHHTMEHLEYSNVTLGGIKEQLINFKECGIISEKEYRILKPERLAAFFETELGKRVSLSKRVEREYPIFMEISYEQLGVSSSRSDIPIVQGIADLFFFEGDEIVLVDYKSDSEENLDKMLDSYKKQVSIYKAALEKMFATRVKQSYIYSFAASKAIDIT